MSRSARLPAVRGQRLTLAAICDGVMEAAWLAALINVPLFFNKYAINSFESEKVYVARSLALLIIGAWAIKGVSKIPLDDVTIGWSVQVLRTFFRRPLVMPIAGCLLIKALATLASIDPSASFWGAQGREVGLFTQLSWFVVFGAMAATVRSPAQADRIVAVAIVSSIPIALYGIVQRFGLDPLFVTERSADRFRVTSTLGNPVFLAAYLIMVTPLALIRLLQAAVFTRNGLGSQFRLALRSLYMVVCLLLLVTLFLTGSRGATFGLLAALFVMCVALGMVWRRRWITAAALAASLVMLAVPMAVAASGLMKSRLTGSPTLQRFAESLNLNRGAGLQRAILWRMASDAATTTQALDLGTGYLDPLHSLRPVLGYGPETVGLVTRRYIPPSLVAEYDGAYRPPDRAHNDAWDTLLTEGVVAVVLHEMILGCLYWYAIRQLGLVTPSQRAFFWSSLLIGGSVGSVALVQWQGLGFLWFGLRIGSTLGLWAFLMLRHMAGDYVTPGREVPTPRQLLIVGILGALVAHSIEITFSFPTVVTGTYFWACAGLLLAAGETRWPTHSSDTKHTIDTRHEANAQSSREDIVGGCLVALVLVNLGFELLWKGQFTSALDILVNALSRAPGNHNTGTIAILVIVMTTWIVAVVLWSDDDRSDGARRRRHWSLVKVGLVSCVATSAFWVLLAVYLSAMGSTEFDRPSLAAVSSAYQGLIGTYYTVNMVIIMVAAAALSDRSASVVNRHRARRAVLMVATVAVVAAVDGAVIWALNVKRSFAAVIAARAETFKARNDWRSVTAIYELSVAAAPMSEHYQVLAGNALLKAGLQKPDLQARRWDFERAEAILTAGHERRPLNTGFSTNLADLYLHWALAEVDLLKRELLAERSADYFSVVQTLEPARFESLNKSAYLDLAFFGRTESALDKIQRSLAIVPESHEALALRGDILATQARTTKQLDLRADLLSRAASSYVGAISRAGQRSSYACALARVFEDMQRFAAAVDMYAKCLVDASPEAKSEIRNTIARLRDKIK